MFQTDIASFKPAWWLPNAHLQTMWPVFTTRISPKLVHNCERFECDDGDFFEVLWTSNQVNTPIVLLLHGLEGSVSSHYIQRLLPAFIQRGWRGAVMHFRGCGGTPNRLLRSYHSGETSDLHRLLTLLNKREPNTPIAVVGFSLGGNVLLKYLGEQGARATLASACAVSVPYDLSQTVQRLSQGFSRRYQQHLLSHLRRNHLAKFKRLAAHHYITAIQRVTTLQQFDDLITAPIHGFANAQDYYQKSSSQAFLSQITVPTLLIHAADDPFTHQDFKITDLKLSASTQLEMTSHGGHVGFISGPCPGYARSWLADRIPQYLQLYLRTVENKWFS